MEDIVTDREDNNVDDGYDVVMAEAKEFERQLNEEEKAHHEVEVIEEEKKKKKNHFHHYFLSLGDIVYNS